MGSFTIGNKVAFTYNNKPRVGTIVETKATFIRLDNDFEHKKGSTVKTFVKDKIQGPVRVIA